MDPGVSLQANRHYVYRSNGVRGHRAHANFTIELNCDKNLKKISLSHQQILICKFSEVRPLNYFSQHNKTFFSITYHINYLTTLCSDILGRVVQPCRFPSIFWVCGSVVQLCLSSSPSLTGLFKEFIFGHLPFILITKNPGPPDSSLV